MREKFQKCIENCGDADLFYQFADKFPYPVQIYAPDGGLLFANQAFCKEFGISSSLIVGRYNILKDETLSSYGVREKVDSAFRGEEPSPVIGIPAPVHLLKRWFFNTPAQDAQMYYLDISSVRLNDKDKNLAFIALIFITRKKLVGREEVVKAEEYINSRCQEEFNIQNVASFVGLSPAHLTRLFKLHSGITPHEYYINSKIDKVKIALMDENLSVEQAFWACGISYHGYYARLFKKITGMLPSQFRKNCCGVKNKE